MKAVRIIVCCHKRDVMARQEPYMPVHVGSILSDKDLHYRDVLGLEKPEGS